MAAKKAGSDGQIRKTTSEWASDTASYLEGMRLMDTDNGTVRVSKGTTYALAWITGERSGAVDYYATVVVGDIPTVVNEENGFGISSIWENRGTGTYRLKITGEFTDDKCTAFVQMAGASDVYGSIASFINEDELEILTWDTLTNTLTDPTAFHVHIHRRP